MQKKENQRIALTKRLLKENLLGLMEGKSIDKITVTELCDASGINRSTFYNHYGCPKDVLRDIENGIIADLEQISKKEGTGRDLPMPQRIEDLCNYLLEHKRVSKLLIRDSDTNSEFAALLFQATHVQATYDQMLSYAQNQDSKRMVTTFLINGSYHMIRQWLLEDIPKTPKEIGELVNLIATQGWVRSNNSKSGEQKTLTYE